METYEDDLKKFEAARCGLNHTYLAGIERGERNVVFLGALHFVRRPE